MHVWQWLAGFTSVSTLTALTETEVLHSFIVIWDMLYRVFGAVLSLTACLGFLSLFKDMTPNCCRWQCVNVIYPCRSLVSNFCIHLQRWITTLGTTNDLLLQWLTCIPRVSLDSKCLSTSLCNLSQQFHKRKKRERNSNPTRREGLKGCSTFVYTTIVIR